jgi:signal transduction histidine kinase
MRHWSRNHRYSLSGKLVLLYLLMAVLFVVLVGGSLGKVLRDHFNYNLRPHLRQYLEYVRQDIGTPPDRQRARAIANKLHIDIHIVGADGDWSSNGKPLDYPALVMDYRFQQDGIEYGRARLGSREIVMARYGDDTLYFDVPNIHPDRKRRSWTPILILLFILFLLYYLTRRMIRPVAALTSGVRRFGQGDLDYRIKLKCRDELGELADNFNEMADDIQQMLDAKRQLLLAISHELRSPLTRAKVSLELIDDELQRQELGKDLVEMDTLIEELLETERLSTSHRVLNTQVCSLHRVIEDVLRDHFTGCDIGKVLCPEAITLDVDGRRLKLLLKNLLDNAVRHTPEGAAPPQIELCGHNDAVTLSVRDYGEGIAAQHIPLLTEPFYRGDASRRRDTGGYGLGLYLCRIIAEAHGGRLSIQSEMREGTTVAVTLPCPQSWDGVPRKPVHKGDSIGY